METVLWFKLSAIEPDTCVRQLILNLTKIYWKKIVFLHIFSSVFFWLLVLCFLYVESLLFLLASMLEPHKAWSSFLSVFSSWAISTVVRVTNLCLQLRPPLNLLVISQRQPKLTMSKTELLISAPLTQYLAQVVLFRHPLSVNDTVLELCEPGAQNSPWLLTLPYSHRLSLSCADFVLHSFWECLLLSFPITTTLDKDAVVRPVDCPRSLPAGLSASTLHPSAPMYTHPHTPHTAFKKSSRSQNTFILNF